jgi:5-methylcytosine-specific restriction endonuclease McrA
MPVRAPSVCGFCGRAHPPGERCERGAAADRERKTRFDAKRPSARQRGYTKEWERERRAFLASHPTCVRCGDPATTVDHIRPHRGDERLFWDQSNWQPLCSHCHNAWKQASERKLP